MNLRIINPAPDDYLGYLEWRQLQCRMVFEKNPTKVNFQEWKFWEKHFKQAMAEDDSPEPFDFNVTRVPHPYWKNKSPQFGGA